MKAKILNASAGSGKTFRLAYKYVRDVVEQPMLYRHILAVTFTNKATEEMKSRILGEIHTLASGGVSGYMEPLVKELCIDEQTVRRRAREVRSRILHDYSHFTVLTIDTFFQRILRAFIKELGIDLNYNVEIETAPVLTKSTDTLIDLIAEDAELRRWMTGFVQERIDEGSRWDIRDGIMTLGAELFKERNRKALGSAPKREELRRIVNRMAERADAKRNALVELAQQAVAIIGGAGCTAADFSGKSRSFANYFYNIASGDMRPPTESIRAKALSTDGWTVKGSAATPLVPALQPILQALCEGYDEGVRVWNTSALVRETYRGFALLSDLYNRVQELCREQNLLLLSETKYLLAEFIGSNDAPFIYEKVGNRFERFMIDEFQDTSVKEWENFLPLLQNAMSQSERDSVLIVGDIKQSIYRWRGGDWQLLHSQAERALGSERTAVENLKRNFRSLPAIVRFNNRSIARIVADDNARLNRDLADAAARGDMPATAAVELKDTLLDAYRSVEQEPVRRAATEGYISIESCGDRPPVVERILEILDMGYRPSDIMILVRSATDGGRVAEELLEFKRANSEERYRFDVMTQEALVVGNAPVGSFIAAAMRLSLNPDDSLNRALYNRYLGRDFDRELSAEERDFFRSLRLLSPEEAFERIVMRHTLDNDKLQTAYLQAVHEQIIAFCSSRIADIQLWLKWWDETGCNRSLSVEASERAVEITTIHKAKGLEKRVVIIPYCTWPLDPRSSGSITNIVWAEGEGEAADAGLFPVRFRKSMSSSGFSAAYFRERLFSHVDNINLLYVAMTRAKESLHIFVPQNRRGEHVGTLLMRTLGHDGERATLGDTSVLYADAAADDSIEHGGMSGRYSATEEGERFEFGTFSPPVPDRQDDKAVRHTILERYPTSEADLRLRLPSDRYFDGEDTVELSPRNFGILMHKAFEKADNEEDIRRAVDDMVADGTLTASEAAHLNATIDKALSDATVRGWFSGRWQRIRNEARIILPASNAVRRPDRVMIDGSRAVVVDYKFGERETAGHREQIREYCRLLREMGHTRTEGYLWYVKRGTVEKVE